MDQAEKLREITAFDTYNRKLGRDTMQISPVEWKDEPGCVAVVYGQRPPIVMHFKHFDDLEAVFARVAEQLRVRDELKTGGV